MLLRIPVDVVVQGPDKQAVTETTHTMVVSAHGGLISLENKVSMAQLLTLKNPETREEQVCRVVYCNDRQFDKAEVGIEFMKPAPTFWRVAFPPSDWARDPEITADTF